MKTISIVGWCNADNIINYGQILQGIALMKVLRNNTSEEINYLSYLPRSFKNKVRCTLERYNPFSGHLLPYLRTAKIVTKYTEDQFVDFRQVSSYEELSRLVNDSDILICGSDQLWHPRNYNKGYFLNFSNYYGKKYSYAVSLPKTHAEEKYINYFENLPDDVHSFEYISVRERETVGLLNSLGVENVCSSLDPTLLLDKTFWEKLINKLHVSENYLFVYIPNGVDEKIAKSIEAIKSKNGIKDVYVLCTRGGAKIKGAHSLKYVDLGQFLYLVENASCVLTTSFHAAVFSIIFEKEFYCYEYYDSLRGEDVRLSSLLNLLGLEDRLSTKKQERLTEKIDYQSVNEKLNKYKAESMQYIRKILEIEQ